MIAAPRLLAPFVLAAFLSAQDTAAELLAKLSLDEKAGQLFVVWSLSRAEGEGAANNHERLLAAVRDVGLGGVILSLGSADDARELIAGLPLNAGVERLHRLDDGSRELARDRKMRSRELDGRKEPRFQRGPGRKDVPDVAAGAKVGELAPRDERRWPQRNVVAKAGGADAAVVAAAVGAAAVAATCCRRWFRVRNASGGRCNCASSACISRKLSRNAPQRHTCASMSSPMRW